MLSLLGAGTAAADTSITVGTYCHLAKAIAYADGTAESGCAPGIASGTTTITLPAGSYNTGVGGTRAITGTAQVVINGDGASTTIISALQKATVFSVDANASLTLNGLTVNGGLGANGARLSSPPTTPRWSRPAPTAPRRARI